jgi:MoaA/NifB/PqqE/SkfB family radical SAM enzyme
MRSIRPDRIRLEASSYCQLRCPSCPTTTGANDAAIGRGFLTSRVFEKLLEENPFVREVELSNYGEILLNPELSAILSVAHSRGVAMRADNGVNLNTASEQALDAIVQYRLRSMTCSLDGASDETYKRYRVRGSFERVIANVRRLNELKAQYKSPYPILTWQFVVFGHNEHELPVARRMARELGMRFRAKLSWDPEFSPIRDRRFVEREVGAASRADFVARTGEDYMSGICHQLWNAPQINWDGRVLGCCRNFWGDFGGNAFEQGVAAVTNSERMSYARAMLEGKQPPREDIPCTTCEIYHARQRTGNWVRTPVVGALRIARAAYRTLHLDGLLSLHQKAKRKA